MSNLSAEVEAMFETRAKQLAEKAVANFLEGERLIAGALALAYEVGYAQAAKELEKK